MEQEQQLLNSIDLDIFKQMNGIDKIKVMKGEGRRYGDTVVGRIYFAEECDLKKPLLIAKGKYNSYWVFNTKSVEVGEV